MSSVPFAGTQAAPVRYLQALRNHAVMIVSLCVLAVGAAALYSATATKRYETQADLVIQPLPVYSGDPFQGFSLFRSNPDGSSPTVIAARVLGTRTIATAVGRKLGDSARGVSFSVDPVSQASLVSITATAPDPRRAALAANAYAAVALSSRTSLFQQQLATRLRQVQAQIEAIPTKSRASSPIYATLAGEVGTLKSYIGASDPTIRIATRASIPTAASWPRPTLSVAVAGIVALLLGVGVAVLLEVIGPKVTREDDLLLGHRLPILARIPRVSARTAYNHLTGSGTLPSEAWKSYRTLRSVLATAGADGGYPRTILVTSATPGDGKTMTAVNLAITLAAAELRVTLVDADFHRPMIATIFNVTARRDGLTKMLFANGDPSECIVDAPAHPRLKLLLSNHGQTHRLHLIDRAHVETLLSTLQQFSDVVVIDSPPLPEVTEALGIAESVEAVLVNVRLGHTLRDKLGELRELLERRGISPLGFIVTTRKRPHRVGTYYDYGHDETAVNARLREADQAKVVPVRKARAAPGSSRR